MAKAAPPWLRRRAPGADPGLVHGFRSGLEDRNAKHLEALGQPVSFEALKVRYVIPESIHKYTPDFELVNGIIVETKGIFDSTDRAKHLLIRAQYPELDIRFVFDNKTTKIASGSKTTLPMWADQYGFKWAIKLIPEAWVREVGPPRKPSEVLKDGPCSPSPKPTASSSRGSTRTS